MNLLEQIKKSPSAHLVLQEAIKFLSDETEKRTAFRNWIDESMKAEFINGEAILHSPIRRKHLKISDLLSRILSIHVSNKKLGVVQVEKAMISLTRNDYEPDICFFGNKKADLFTADQMLFPAPDLVVEILSKSTAKRDRGIKFEDYAAHGITEYWIIDPDKQKIEQFALLGDLKEYFPIATVYYDDDIKSKVVEGFEIPLAAIFDEHTNIEALRKLIAE